jgi:hypothetical protein
MSSTRITALLAAAALLVIGSFLVSAWFARRRQLRKLQAVQNHSQELKTSRLTITLFNGTTMGIPTSTGQLTSPQPSLVPSAHFTQGWYNRRRMLVSLGLLGMLALTLFIQTGGAGDAFQSVATTLHNTLSNISGVNISTAAQVSKTASDAIVRVDSADRSQYNNVTEYQVWSYSSCSGISMEEVMDAYGSHYNAGDVLEYEYKIGVWSISAGLLGGAPSLAKVADHYGFQANANPLSTIDAIVAMANKGFPVIVGSNSHIMVIKGGDADHVYAVDSSEVNRQTMTRAAFAAFWNGFSVLITPKGVTPQ